MTRFKDFGAPAQTKEPITFALHGEEFTAVPEIQGRVLMSFVERAGSENPAEAANLTIEFFRKVLVDESWERFEALTEDKEKIVSVELLAEIVSWLIEEYTNRPEEPREV
ncbi:tail assembly chaperone [Microbacterium phage Cece]|nr:tail assembly chaperone [Microbacterium phage Cece]